MPHTPPAPPLPDTRRRCHTPPAPPLSGTRRRRPATRRLLAVVALAVILIAVAAPAVSAETIVIDETEFIIDDTRYEFDKKIIVSGENRSSAADFAITFDNYQDVANVQTILWKPSASDGNFVLYDEDIHTESYNVQLRESVSSPVDIIGSGQLTYYKGKNTGQSHVRIDIDNIDTSLMSKFTSVIIDDEKVYNLQSVYGKKVLGGETNYLRTKNVDLLPGTIEIEYTSRFTHTISLEPYNEEKFLIRIDRDGIKRGSTDGRNSIVSIYDNGGNILYTNTGSTTVSTNVDKNLQPYTVIVESIAYNGKTYTGYLGAGEPWIPPGEEPTPTPPDIHTPVTVYIQNSQTGALLANANLAISANVGGNFYEVVNETVPSGIYSIELQPTGGGKPNPDYYRLWVTLDGYNSQMPYMDFEFKGETSVYVYMEPTAGGPDDENKTYIEFYVRDLNANPIAGAAVTCGGYTLITNSAGYTQFELPNNAAYLYRVTKSGYVTIEGRATVTDAPRHTVNVVLGAGEIPTHTPTLGPGETPGGPGATPTPDTRTNEEKGQAVIDMLADNAEGIGALALICLLMGLLKLMVKW